jgi:WD40 repeat protein
MDGTAKVWDVQSGSCLYPLQTCRKVSSDPDDLRNTFISASFSSDGTILVTLNPEGVVRLWNVETGQCMLTIDRFGTDSFFYEAYLTADTSKLVISGTNSTEIWDFRVRVSAAEKIMYDAFVASGLSQVENAQITNPYALQLLQKLNSRAAPGNELIPGITQPNLLQRARAIIGSWFTR